MKQKKVYLKLKKINSIDSPLKCNVIVITRGGNIMKDIKEIKRVILSLLSENKFLKSIIFEKDKIIRELMSKIEDLQNDIEYSKASGDIKKLVLKRG